MMKPISKKHIIRIIVFLLIIAIIVLIALSSSLFLKRTPFNVAMHGAEVTDDATVIRKLDFQLSGKITITDSELSDEITLQPLDLGDIILNIDHSSVLYYISDTCSVSRFLWYDGSIDDFRSITLRLARDFSCCVITFDESRYFVGSIDPSFDPPQIMAYFEDIGD